MTQGKAFPSAKEKISNVHLQNLHGIQDMVGGEEI